MPDPIPELCRLFSVRINIFLFLFPDPIPELCRLLAVSINIPVTQISIQKYTWQKVSDPYDSVVGG